MDGVFTVATLNCDEARQAYPLVRLSYPALRLDQWLAFAHCHARNLHRRTGLLVVKDARGYIHAACTYQVENHIRAGQVLRVTELIMARLPGQGLGHTLACAIDDLASRTNCSAVVVDSSDLLDDEAEVCGRAMLLEAGFVPYSTSGLRKELRRAHTCSSVSG